MVWSELISDLVQRGYTTTDIGSGCGVTGAAIRALIINAGQEPRWITGDRLIALHKKVMRRRK